MNEVMQHDAIAGPMVKVNTIGQPAVWRQLRANIVAIVSVLVALGGLTYSTWRNERTEANRSIRVAAFEVLKTLGELQVVVDYTYYRKDRSQGDATMGWRRVQCIKDLTQIVPSPGPEDAERLLQAWRTNVGALETDAQSAAEISNEIYTTRQDMVAISAACGRTLHSASLADFATADPGQRTSTAGKSAASPIPASHEFSGPTLASAAWPGETIKVRQIVVSSRLNGPILGANRASVLDFRCPGGRRRTR